MTTRRNILPGFGISTGFTLAYMSLVVLIPLSAVFLKAASVEWSQFWATITAPRLIASYKLTLTTSFVSALLNAGFGLLVAWVLTRDDFPGKRLVDAVIDLPFALPTIVASLVMLALYGPNSPIDLHLQHTKWGIGVALLFVTLPFVVRSVQPVLMELDHEAEEAAASLGANGWTTFRKIILPALFPALLSGAGLAFARAIGEFGSVVLIGGGIPRETEVASQYIAQQIEIDRPASAAAVSVVLLLISFAVLFTLRLLTTRKNVA